MRSINHIITGVTSLAAVAMTVYAISTVNNLIIYDVPINTDIFTPVVNYLNWSGSSNIAVLTIVMLVNFALFLLGCLLPDIDQANSMIGKIVHLPIQHRTWTHTIWVIILFIIAAKFIPCFACLTAGYTLHIFFDSLSKGGICWFYPISRYKIWTSGAQVKKNHKIYLYRTGETSENVTTAFVVMINTSFVVCDILLSAGLIHPLSH